MEDLIPSNREYDVFRELSTENSLPDSLYSGRATCFEHEFGATCGYLFVVFVLFFLWKRFRDICECMLRFLLQEF